MRGIIVANASNAGWGFVESESADGQKSKFFFHVRNSPTYQPVLGQAVEFELAPPFKLGQPDQAVNLRPVQVADCAMLLYRAVKS
jgi:hypothetical protein